MILSSIALLLAGAANAASHIVSLRANDGVGAYEIQFKAADQAPIKIKKSVTSVSGDRKTLFFEGSVNSQGERVLIYFQFEMRGAEGAPELKYKGDLEFRKGESMTIVDCGAYQLELAIDGALKSGADAKAGPWKSEMPENTRVTVSASRGGRTVFLCRSVVKFSFQSDVSMLDSRGKLLHFTTLPRAAGNGMGIEYNVDYAVGREGAISHRGVLEDLAAGQYRTESAGGCKISLVMDGVNPFLGKK